MKTNISISEAESVVMEQLWQRHPQSAEDVVAALASSQEWQEATVKTLLSRLLKKGAVCAEKDGRRYLYIPVLKRQQWINAESKSFVDRMFGGQLAPLVAHFGKHRKLSKKDIEELKRLIEDMEDGE
jgi:predicted transcriptional regulator